MIYASENENAIYLWWDKRYDFIDGCYYRVVLDETTTVYTKDILFDFFNIDMSIKHNFAVDLLDKNNKVVGKTEYFETKQIFPKRTAIDVTKAPYNAKPDGVTDCTDAIIQAFSDCDKNKFVYFPLGTYFCREVSFGGNVKVVYDSGATIVDRKVTGLC